MTELPRFLVQRNSTLSKLRQDFSYLTTEVLGKGMAYVNKQLQDALMNYFLQNYVSEILRKSLGHTTNRAVHREILSQLTPGGVQYIKLLQLFEEQIIELGHQEQYENMLKQFIFEEELHNKDSQIWKPHIRKRMLSLLLFVRWIHPQKEEVSNLHDIWDLIFPDFQLPKRGIKHGSVDPLTEAESPIMKPKQKQYYQSQKDLKIQQNLMNNETQTAQSDNECSNIHNFTSVNTNSKDLFTKKQQLKIIEQLQEHQTSMYQQVQMPKNTWTHNPVLGSVQEVQKQTDFQKSFLYSCPLLFNNNLPQTEMIARSNNEDSNFNRHYRGLYNFRRSIERNDGRKNSFSSNNSGEMAIERPYSNNNNNSSSYNNNYTQFDHNNFDNDQIFNALDLDQHDGVNYHSICPILDPINHSKKNGNMYQDEFDEQNEFY